MNGWVIGLQRNVLVVKKYFGATVTGELKNKNIAFTLGFLVKVII